MTVCRNRGSSVGTCLMENRLYVGNLAEEVAASSLQELFEQFGFVMDVKLVAQDQKGQRSSGAFVTMATDEAAKTAMKALNGANLNGKVVTVEMACEEDRMSRLRPRKEL